MIGPRSHALVLAALVLCASLAVTGGAIASGDWESADSGEFTGESGSLSALAGFDAAQTDDENEDDEREDGENETKRHENPDEYGEDDDLGNVESWLVGWLGGRLGEGAIELSQRQYELARGLLGESFRDRFGQYVDVAGETEGEGAGETFQEARDTEEQLADQLEAYEETSTAYERAVENDEPERARELARELESAAERVRNTSADLRELLELLGARTEVDLSDATAALLELDREIRSELVEVLETEYEETRTAYERAVENDEPERARELARELESTAERIESRQQLDREIASELADILETEFVETSLVVETDGETVSFLDPLELTGQLRTIDGDPVANESVRLTGGIGESVTETDAAGEFTLESRPTAAPLSTSSVLVRYVPADRSVYRASAARVNVTVEQVEPRFVGVAAPEEVAYGDTVDVSGELVVDDIPVDGVSVDVLLDDQQLGETEVSNGSFDGAFELPASVPAGERSLSVRLDFEGRALAGVTATRPIVVRETETELSVTASQVEGRTVRVTGALETEDGLGVGGEPVQVTVGATAVGTVTTAPDGTFEELVTVPDSVAGEVGAGVQVAASDVSRTAPEFDVGDVDESGEITIVDAMLIQQYLVGKNVSINEALADVDRDGEVAIVDAMLLQQLLVGIVTEAGLDVSNLDAPETVPGGSTLNVSADLENLGGIGTVQDAEFRLASAEGGLTDPNGTLASNVVDLGPPGSGNETGSTSYEIDTTDVPGGDYFYGVFTDDDQATSSVTVLESDSQVSNASGPTNLVRERTVRVTYQRNQSNLGPSDAETTVELQLRDQQSGENPENGTGPGNQQPGEDPTGQQSGGESGVIDRAVRGDGLAVWEWLLVGVGVVAGLSLLLWGFRRVGGRFSGVFPGGWIDRLRGRFGRRRTEGTRTLSDIDAVPEDFEESETDLPPAVALLRDASDRLQDGDPETAAQACYAAARWTLEPRVDVPGAPTHREFYRAYTDQEDSESTAALRDLTETYERAVFSNEYVSADDVRGVLDSALRLCAVDDTQSEAAETADD